VDAYIDIRTKFQSYAPNENVELDDFFNDWWGASSWKYRKEVNISDSTGVARTDVVVNVPIHFEDAHAYNNSIRVIYNGTLISAYIWNTTFNGTNYSSATISFVANVSASSTETYHIYYTDSNVGAVANNPIVGNSVILEDMLNGSDISSSYKAETPYTWDSAMTETCTGGPFYGNMCFRSDGNDYNINGWSVGIGNGANQIRKIRFGLYLDDADADMQLQINCGDWNHRWGFDVEAVYNGYGFAPMQGSTVNMAQQTWHYIEIDLIDDVACTSGSTLVGIAFSSDNSDAHVDYVSLNQPAMQIDVGKPEYMGSSLFDIGPTDTAGYLLMKIQRYFGGGWVDVETVLNDMSTNTSRWVKRYDYLTLDTLFNQWNTKKSENGTYRTYVSFNDKDGNILEDQLGNLILDTYEFNITNPDSNIQLNNITIYDVSSALNKHTDTTILIGSGLNTNFTLFTNSIYRVEIHMQNLPSSSEMWNISSANITHFNLNSSWTIDQVNDIWYSNGTNFTGGTWGAGNVTWDTSLGGWLNVSEYAVFYYIMNVSISQADERQVIFLINDTDFVREDNSTYKIVISEDIPPGLDSNIYNITPTAAFRGDTLQFYAKWDENIGSAVAEYNSSTSALKNHTITPAGVWTNRTIDTNTSWILGMHKAKIYAADLNDNWNKTLPYLSFSIWGTTSIVANSISDDNVTVGSVVTIRCRVRDDASAYQDNYTMYFYNSTGLMGTNQTNSSGWASWTFTDNSLGTENIICNISDMPERYYNVTAPSEAVMPLTAYETNPPWYSNVSANTTAVHRGERISYFTLWHDDYLLDDAWLETNETGVMINSSLSAPIALTGNESWSSFNVTIPAAAILGPMGWRIHADDTFGNMNSTPFNTTYIWGWASLTDSDLDPSNIYENTTTNFTCRVMDAVTGAPIANYTVYFYNSTHLLGTNLTDATGWARRVYNDSSNGSETMVCNITDEPTLWYNDSAINERTEPLYTAKPGEDLTPPGINAGNYGITKTKVYKGENFTAYAQWTELVNTGWWEYNTTNSSTSLYDAETPYTNNWTNLTVIIGANWYVGNHSIKGYANDTWNNINDTLPYLTFNVWGISEVNWVSPTGNQDRGTINLTCIVTDSDSGDPIAGYTVGFYNSTDDFIGNDISNATGHATISEDFSNYDVGPELLKCRITDAAALFYDAIGTGFDDDTETLTLFGYLNATIEFPPNGSIYNRNTLVYLNSSSVDDLGAPIVPDNATWLNSTYDNISTGEKTNWTIPTNYKAGVEVITLNVSKQYYHQELENVSIIIWGFANATWASPATGSTYGLGTTIPLRCDILDTNNSDMIEDYPVYFYYKNMTETSYNYIDVNVTLSNGRATINWDTTGLPEGNYSVMCNITDNASIYYNASVSYNASAIINLSSAGMNGRLEVTLLTPPIIPGLGNASKNGGYKVGQNRTFVVTANVTCRVASCGNVQGTIRYNLTADPDTAINIIPDTPFYIVDAVAQNPKNCAGNPLNVNDSCLVNWTINATGAILSTWEIDVLFDGSTAVSNDTNNTVIEITKVLIIVLSNNTINYGTLFPGDTCNESQTNPIVITLHNNSNDADGIYIKATNLTNGGNQIGVKNMSWALVNNCPLSDNLTANWSVIQSPVSSGTQINTYYFIGIPPTPAIQYTGNAYIMANASL